MKKKHAIAFMQNEAHYNFIYKFSNWLTWFFPGLFQSHTMASK